MSWKSMLSDYPKPNIHNKKSYIYPIKECRIINLILELLVYFEKNKNLNFYRIKYNINFNKKIIQNINIKKLNNIIDNLNQLVIYTNQNEILFYIHDNLSKNLGFKNRNSMIQKIKKNDDNNILIINFSASIISNDNWFQNKNIQFHTYKGLKKEFSNNKNKNFYSMIFQIAEKLYNDKDKIYNERLLSRLIKQKIHFINLNSKIFFNIKDFSIKNFNKYYSSMTNHITNDNKLKIHSKVYINSNGLKQLLLKINNYKANIIMQQLRLDINEYKDKIKKIKILNNIINVFKDHKYEKNYNVENKYFLDLYFINLKLALEFEKKNNNENKMKIIYIKNKLNCQIIQINYNHDNFNIFDIIRLIHIFIINKFQKK